jgi:Cu/Ag efflux pump CusA
MGRQLGGAMNRDIAADRKNLLSLSAIDFGIIVDGAIVMMDAILRRR